MTDVVTATCATCGADIYGTRFCENCGKPAGVAGSTAQAATAATLATAVVQPATASRGARALRVITLLFLLSTILVPAIIQVLPPTGNEFELQRDALATLQVFTGLFALLSALPGVANSGAKFGGVLFALGYIALTMTEDFTAVLYQSQFEFYFWDVVGFLLLFLCWAVTRPFRGPGYLGIVFIVIFETATVYIALGLEESGAQFAVLWNSLIEIVLVLAAIGFTALFERRTIASPAAGITVGDGSVNAKARTSLTLAMVAIGLNIISRLVPYDLGLVLSIFALALLVTAIVVGHIARREIRTTHQRGSGMAAVGLVIGYVILGLDLALIVFAVGAVALAFSSL
jgi:hypothetical protein